MDTDTVTERHYRKTMSLREPELVRQLVEHLGPTLVAALAGVRDRKLPHKWARPDGPSPRPETLNRLQVAHRAWLAVADAESESLARAWFIGANPRLGEESPVACLRAGDVKAVLAASQAFANGLDG